MSINIKNREAEDLLRQICAATGKGITEVVVELLRREAGYLRRRQQLAARKRRIDKLARRYRARLPAKPQSTDAIIGYDENGLPS
jgi:antitoxin VapB